jgi:hypothetical protein
MKGEIVWYALRIVEDELGVEFTGHTQEDAKQFIMLHLDESKTSYRESKFEKRITRRKIENLLKG